MKKKEELVRRFHLECKKNFQDVSELAVMQSGTIAFLFIHNDQEFLVKSTAEMYSAEDEIVISETTVMGNIICKLTPDGEIKYARNDSSVADIIKSIMENLKEENKNEND